MAISGSRWPIGMVVQVRGFCVEVLGFLGERLVCNMSEFIWEKRKLGEEMRMGEEKKSSGWDSIRKCKKGRGKPVAAMIHSDRMYTTG